MQKPYRLLLCVKSIDGGTGTFVFSLLKLAEVFPQQFSSLRVVVYEKPRYRNVDEKYRKYFTYLHKDAYYPEQYGISLNAMLGFMDEIRRTKSVIDKIQPHMVVSIDIHANLVVLCNKLLFFRKTKMIITTHIDLSSTLKEKSSIVLNTILRWTVRYVYRFADEHICISKGLSKSLFSHFNLKLKPKVIYYGIAPHILKRDKKNSVNPTIISVGRLVEQKDHKTLINAFRIVCDKRKATLMIVGDGPLKNQLRSFVHKKGLDESIRFVGWKQDVLPLLKKSDLFVLSSKREGFGYVLIEAMSQGIPVVSTDAPYGPSEILGKGAYGLLSPVGDSESLAKNILMVLEHKKYALYSDKSRQRSMFITENKMLRNYKKIIIKLLHTK